LHEQTTRLIWFIKAGIKLLFSHVMRIQDIVNNIPNLNVLAQSYSKGKKKWQLERRVRLGKGERSPELNKYRPGLIN
jgi:hypothetical protein